PLNPVFSSITGVSQGVVIARINGDITLADFESSVLNLLKDVEDTYWDLQLAYHSFHTAVEARNSAQESWRVAKVTDDAGGGRKIDEPQARDQYFEARAAVESALSTLYGTETELRRLMGVEVSGPTVIRPITKLTQVELKTDWQVSLAEALTRRVELRKQKWNIKSLDLQLRAAQSLTNPRLDFVSSYRLNGIGDHLFAGSDNDVHNTQQGFNSAYETITQGNQTGWTLGFEFSLPLGFRSARSQVRNLELRLTKAREVLNVQEMEIAHQLASVIQNLATFHATAESHYNRYLATQERVHIVQLEYTNDKATLDEVLRAQRSRASAEAAYYTNLVNYNKSITQLHLAKGTLLEYNSIQLQENDWDPAAYEQALRRAWARSHGIDAEHVFSEPEVFAFDVHPESSDDGATAADENPTPQPLPVLVPEPTPVPETAPKPAPKPADKPIPAPAASQETSAGQSPDPTEKNLIVPTSAQEQFTEPHWLTPIVRQPPLLSEPRRVPSRRAAKLPIAQ
ncbi:MAG: TolC family protein, partial [Planctomycetaceae bacterium]